MTSSDSSSGTHHPNAAGRDHAETLAFLDRLTTSVLGLSDPEEIIQVAERALGEHLKASRVFVAEASPDEQFVTVPREWLEAGMPSVAGTHRLDDYGEQLLKDYRAGKPHIRRNAMLENPPGPELEALKRVRAIAAIDVPILIDGRFQILFVVHQAAPRDWTESEIALVRQVADRTAAEVHRARALKEARAERENLASIVEQAPAFICVLRGPDHVLELANDSYHRLAGRRLELGKPIREVLPEVEGQGYFEKLDEVYRTGQPFIANEVPVTLAHERDADRHRHVSFVYQALRGPDLKTNGIFVHGVDVTDLLKSRQDVLNSERLRRQSLEAAGVGSFNIDPGGNDLETDETFRRIFGCQGASLTYEEAFAIIHPDDRQLVRDAVAKATDPDNPAPYYAEYRVIHPDGTVRWVAARGKTTTRETPNGELLTSFDGIVGDITERKNSENEIAFQRHLLELVFRGSPAAMALWRGEDLVFERVNPDYQALFGRRELLGRPLMEALPELAGQGFDDLLLKVLRTGEPHTATEVLAKLSKSDDGPVEDRYFDFTYLQVQDPSGKPYGVYDHSIDVTERVLASRRLAASQQELEQALHERQSLLDAERSARNDAEAAGRMKDQFLATLSHELRTPLNAIVGWTHLLQIMPDLSERVAEGLKVISRNAKAQTQIIEDILDMSRIVSGKLTLDLKDVDLAGLVKAGAETVQPTATVKGVELEVSLGASDYEMRGDPHRLHQVFWNLISNAVKFTPQGGKVRVSLDHAGSSVVVRVADTGEGIPPEFLPHVFDRFRQADATTTRRHGGLGLGLAIVKQIVELHGGSVSAESPGPGQGSAFIVSLPVCAPDDSGVDASVSLPERAATADHVASDRLAGVSVVAVDDEPDAVAFVERLLTGCGAKVRTAHSAAEALELIRNEPPTVIVSDIGMPGEDGYAFIGKVRALPIEDGGRTAALAVTAYARTIDRVKALEAGFQMHIAKPVEPAELVAAVTALANLQRPA
ncbi:ATP-binding protein [Luteolibacter soli]|uniref:histidine kinase n=1 Tax=Luteolibacter soli TaxID=3135280 RepID=A0ABU9AXE5_9BACT